MIGPDVPKDRGTIGEASPNSASGKSLVQSPDGRASTSGSSRARIHFDRYVLDLQRGCLLLADEEIALRPKTFEFLHYLVGNPGRLVSKDELLKSVWPTVLVTEDSLVQCVTELRRALHDPEQRLIRTVPRRGYRFEAIPSTGLSAALPDAVDPQTLSSEPEEERAPLRQGRSAGLFRRVPMLAAISTIVIGALAVFIAIWLRLDPGENASYPPLSLVVLPFQNLGSNPDQDYFAEGIASDLTTDLSRLPGLFVIAHATARTFRGSRVDARQIGRDLHVRYVLEGSVGRADGQVRINAQLSDVETGAIQWAERYERERDQLRAWRNEIIGRIALALNYRLAAVESERALRERHDSPEASDLTMQGWALVYAAKAPGNYGAARSLFRQAVEQDRQAVNALAGIAWTSAVSVLDGWSASPVEDLGVAQEAVAQALAVNPNHVVAHHVRGFVLRLQRRSQSAHDAFQTVIGLNPNFAPGYAQLGAVETELGRPQATARLIEHALRLSPRDPSLGPWFAIAGMAELHSGHDQEAATWLTRAVDTGTPVALHHAYLASALALAGRISEARATLAEFQTAKPGATIASLRARAHSTEPRFIAQREHFYAGLRLAGLPE